MLANQEHQKIAAKLASGDMPYDEPLFTLRARDKFAPTVIRFWIDLVTVQAKSPSSHVRGKLQDAEEIARAMDAWPIKQVPGCPETRSVMTQAEREFRERLEAQRDQIISELLDLKVSEWLNDGPAEVVRVLTLWVNRGQTWTDEDIVELSEGLLWNVDP